MELNENAQIDTEQVRDVGSLAAAAACGASLSRWARAAV